MDGSLGALAYADVPRAGRAPMRLIAAPRRSPTQAGKSRASLDTLLPLEVEHAYGPLLWRG